MNIESVISTLTNSRSYIMTEFTQREALVIVDAQRGFMPQSEGERLNLPGFGELGVEGGQNIVERLNALTTAMSEKAFGLIATTQDWHPRDTAHISDNPDYLTTWPTHCIAETPGAELHPDLLVAQNAELATRFIKGDKACATPEEDDSYTGALAYNPTTEQLLPDWLREQGANTVYVAGLALGDGGEHPLCVDSTARDLHNEGFNVALITDAAEAVVPANRAVCFANLGTLGIRLVTTDEALKELA
jgi:nicotinamidase/pyrazinamidase